MKKGEPLLDQEEAMKLLDDLNADGITNQNNKTNSARSCVGVCNLMSLMLQDK